MFEKPSSFIANSMSKNSAQELGCLCDIIWHFPRQSRHKVKRQLQEESKDLEITKSLLNLLHNIVNMGSVPVSRSQKDFFDSHAGIVNELLSSKKSLQVKKKLLESNISLTINIAGSCPPPPTVAGW